LVLHSVFEPLGEKVAVEVLATRVTADTASSLAFIFHELATNAVQYGALSSTDGHVELRGSEAADRSYLAWVERGGPPVQPTRPGFASRVLELSMNPEAGEVLVASVPDGLTARIFVKRPRS